MTPDELMNVATDLAAQSVANGWGGPFGAVVAKDGEIVGMGQNRVLLTGDITAHAEMEAIRKTVAAVNPYAPSIAPHERNLSTLTLIPRPEGSNDPVPERSAMLNEYEMYASGFPCPMCMGAIYWARISRMYFACSVEDARAIGFDDAFQYEDFALPLDQRRIPISQIGQANGLAAFALWRDKADKHPY